MNSERHAARRSRLRRAVEGPILLLGNGPRARNLPMNELPFRQDSTFLYFTGCTVPGAACLLDDDGYTLFLPPKPKDDALWHGPSPSFEDVRQDLGADRVLDVAQLEQRIPRGPVRTLAVADASANRLGTALTGLALEFGRQPGDEALMDAVIMLRRVKDDEEIAEMVEAGRVSRLAFEQTMRATAAGSHERSLWTLFEGILRLHGCVPGYQTILTQSGEILHHHGHDAPLQDGRMVLLDGGGELESSGYTVDITRTWPVCGTFTSRQRAAYAAVLEAQEVAIAACRAQERYRHVHDAASAVLARFLVDEGLLRGTVEEVLERHAHALFFPHGVGHHLGLDVHDLENFGDRPSYPPDQGRPAEFGTANLRLDLPLEAGWVVTVEPGFYIVPGILQDPELRSRFGDLLDDARLEAWAGFGGIRIEDDVLVTESGPRVLTDVPKQISDIEAIVGQGPTAESRLCPS